MMDSLTIRPLIRRVDSSKGENGSDTQYFAATSRTFAIDPRTDQVVGIALTRKKTQIESHGSWTEFCDAVGLASVQVLWANEMAAFPVAAEPDNEPQSAISEAIYEPDDSGDLLSEMPRLIGDEIRARRRRRDWTQVELAERLDVSPESISDWENGKAVPTMVNLANLATMLTPQTEEESPDSQYVPETGG